eukprot:m.124792 g.124792  ORF g.124792 m.124792 type:complete len:137 (-) comp29082_c0_seq1:26-436(-)
MTWLRTIVFCCGIALAMAQTFDDLEDEVTSATSNMTTLPTTEKRTFVQAHPTEFFGLMGGIAATALISAIVAIHYKRKPRDVRYKYNAYTDEYTPLVSITDVQDYDTIQEDLSNNTAVKVPEGWIKPEHCDWESNF